MDAVRVFISYAHEDDGLREKLQTHLSQLKRDGLVAAWDDRQIPAGKEWADEIDSRLEDADITLLLVSADFINSDFCYGKEMTRAIQRHEDEKDRAIVIPVILRKCDWHTSPFARFQALPRDGKPMSDPMWRAEDDYFEAVATGLRRRIKQLSPQLTADAQAPVVRRRERKWWERTGVRWVLLIALVLVCAVGGWWIRKRSAVDGEIAANLMAMHQGRYSDARDAFERLSQDWIGRTRGAWALEKARLGVLLEQGGDIQVEQFETAVNKLSKAHPGDADVLLFEGALAARNGNDDLAAAKLKEALKIEPNFPEAHYNWADLLMRQGRLKDALDHIDQAVTLAPNAPHYRNTRAFFRRMKGDPAGAADDYRLSAEAGSISSRLELGLLLWTTGNFEEAAAQQERALDELQKNNAGSKGRNFLPWRFNKSSAEVLTIKELRDKRCFGCLSLVASQFVLGKPVQPETEDCGENRRHIVDTVIWHLNQALDTGLAEAKANRARQFIQVLEPVRD